MISTKGDDDIMSVVRVHKTKNYTVLSNYHFREKDMSLKAKGLLSLMLSLPDTWNYSVSGLVTLSKDGKDSVMSALAELEKFRYLERERITNDKGQFAGIEYHIYEAPKEEKPLADIPIEENSTLENPIAENPSQLNTNQLITKSIKNNTEELNIYKPEVEEDIEVILATISYPSLVELYREYIEMRKSINAPLTALGLEKLVKRNERLTRGDYNLQKVLLEAAIINNWKNVYLPNEAEVSTVNKLKIQELRDMYGIE
jgi:hypothetical protein